MESQDRKNDLNKIKDIAQKTGDDALLKSVKDREKNKTILKDE
jgi:hypothetical protein